LRSHDNIRNRAAFNRLSVSDHKGVIRIGRMTP